MLYTVWPWGLGETACPAQNTERCQLLGHKVFEDPSDTCTANTVSVAFVIVTSLKSSLLITRCAYAQGRVKRLSPSIYLFVCVCGCVCRQKTRLFAVLPLENRHEIALYRSASQFIFFERCLESRTSLLSSAMAMGF